MRDFGDRATWLSRHCTFAEWFFVIVKYICAVHPNMVPLPVFGKVKAEGIAVCVHEVVMGMLCRATAVHSYDRVTAAAYFASVGAKLFLFCLVWPQIVGASDECILKHGRILLLESHFQMCCE